MLALILVAVSVGFSNLAASIGIGVGGVSRGTRWRVVLIFGLLEAGMPILGLVLGRDLASSIGRETKWFAAALLVAVGGYGVVRSLRNRGLAGIRPPRSRPEDSAQHLLPQGMAWQDSEHLVRSDPDDMAPESQVRGSSDDPVRRRPDRQNLPGLLKQGGGRESVKLFISGIALSMDNLIAGFALGTYQVNIVAGALVFGVVSIGLSLAGLEFGARLGRRAGESGELIGGVVLIGVGIAIALGVVG